MGDEHRAHLRTRAAYRKARMAWALAEFERIRQEVAAEVRAELVQEQTRLHEAETREAMYALIKELMIVWC